MRGFVWAKHASGLDESVRACVPQQAMLNGIHNAVIIYNPVSGRDRKNRLQQLQAAGDILQRAGIRAELWATSAPGTATLLARRAVCEQYELVIACGGDGTVNEVVNGLAGSAVPMAVLPSGTANVLAKELGIPWDIPAAARLILGGMLRRVALGLAVPADILQPQRYFLCLAGAGPDGEIVNAVDFSLKTRHGILAYWLEGFWQLANYSFPKFRVVTPERECEASLLVIGRTKHYGGPVRITTEADLFENCFELLAVTTRSRFRYTLGFLWLMLGRHRKLKQNLFWKTASIRCQPLGDRPIHAQADGEPIGTLPMDFRIVPEALTLVVPDHQAA